MQSPTDAPLSVAIRAWRKAAGLTQEALAELIEVGQTTLSAWELGHTAPERAAFWRLVRALGVDRDTAALLYGYGDSEGPAC